MVRKHIPIRAMHPFSYFNQLQLQFVAVLCTSLYYFENMEERREINWGLRFLFGEETWEDWAVTKNSLEPKKLKRVSLGGEEGIRTLVRFRAN